MGQIVNSEQQQHNVERKQRKSKCHEEVIHGERKNSHGKRCHENVVTTTKNTDPTAAFRAATNRNAAVVGTTKERGSTAIGATTFGRRKTIQAEIGTRTVRKTKGGVGKKAERRGRKNKDRRGRNNKEKARVGYIEKGKGGR